MKLLREQVLEANLEVVRRGLVLYTFGNVSGISREDNLVVIKPSGVPYERMKADDLVITDLDGKIVWGELRPSSDLDTHIHLYKSFPEIGGVVHTHSEHATAWAQACRSIPALGTTHADYFYGPVPITRELTADEIKNDYVRATGVAITDAFGNRDPMEVPAALVAGHGPFAWGRTPDDAVHNAVVLEAVARMAMYTFSLQPNAQGVSQALLDRHYFRKHGATATYGQAEK
ncbi:L-ribulose-5-phosphate 4-epimerase AraD [Microvirga sp. 3-52]|nr:L-ribulose-5-phosphate 4-epimerase AraD [Microvirga sp. 3-52]MBS7451315.1 L-ribulose-5-phosphate 4-epimerase AraD [Microvirga sp. 3-52]